MYVLQHTQKHNMLPEGTDLAALGLGLSKGRRISVSTPSSLASSRSDVSRDERGDRVHAAGPYMEGNMHLLATMWVLHFLTFSFIFIIIIIIVTFFFGQHYEFHLDSNLADLSLADGYEDESLIRRVPQLTGKMKLIQVMYVICQCWAPLPFYILQKLFITSG